MKFKKYKNNNSVATKTTYCLGCEKKTKKYVAANKLNRDIKTIVIKRLDFMLNLNLIRLEYFTKL